jgi:hypothetical protein
MLSSFLTKSSDNFANKWNRLLNLKQWQTIKAFNRRMCWEWDEFNDMKPVSDFHDEVTKELEYFIAHPSGWNDATTPSMQKKNIDRVKQEFSKQLLAFSRLTILKNYHDEWNKAIQLSGSGSTTIRKTKIHCIIKEILPEHKRQEAVQMKNAIKNLLIESINVCKV